MFADLGKGMESVVEVGHPIDFATSNDRVMIKMIISNGDLDLNVASKPWVIKLSSESSPLCCIQSQTWAE